MSAAQLSFANRRIGLIVEVANRPLVDANRENSAIPGVQRIETVSDFNIRYGGNDLVSTKALFQLGSWIRHDGESGQIIEGDLVFASAVESGPP